MQGLPSHTYCKTSLVSLLVKSFHGLLLTFQVGLARETDCFLVLMEREMFSVHLRLGARHRRAYMVTLQKRLWIIEQIDSQGVTFGHTAFSKSGPARVCIVVF